MLSAFARIFSKRSKLTTGFFFSSSGTRGSLYPLSTVAHRVDRQERLTIRALGSRGVIQCCTQELEVGGDCSVAGLLPELIAQEEQLHRRGGRERTRRGAARSIVSTCLAAPSTSVQSAIRLERVGPKRRPRVNGKFSARKVPRFDFLSDDDREEVFRALERTGVCLPCLA